MKCRYNKERSCKILNEELGNCEIEDDGVVEWRCSDYISEEDGD